jgi:putative ABC transport system permease protein
MAAAFQTLRANPLHTSLSTVGIIIGVGSLVAILALGDGMEQFAREQIESTTDLLMITVQPRATERLGGVMVRRTDVPELSADDASALREQLAGRARVTLHASAGVEMRVAAGAERTGAIVRGTLSDAAEIGKLTLQAGRFFTDAELEAKTRVAVLDATLAGKVAGGPNDAVGTRVMLGTAEFEVVGVTKAGNGGPPVAYVPITTFGATSPMAAERLPSLAVLAEKVEDVPALRASIDTWLKERFADRSGAVSVISNDGRVAQARRAILLFKMVMGAITGISILVGGVGVMNVLLVSIIERTREIGIRKATGARRRDIAIQFLTESVTISVSGSLLGIALGLAGVFAFAPIVRSLTEAPFRPAMTGASIGFALALGIVVGIVFGTYPALRAARLTPLDAIRHE